VTVDPSAYEGRLDPGLDALVPPTLDVVRARAWTPASSRRLGIGDLGLRAFAGLRRVCRGLMARERFDALFITIYPVYPALLGASLKREFHVPFVLDYQDPWVGEWGRSVGGGRAGAPDWKSRASRRLGEWLEPKAIAAADAITAVSQGTIDGIVHRNPSAGRLPTEVLPLGFEPRDFDSIETSDSSAPFDVNDGGVHLCYVGTLLPTGIDTLRLLLTALARVRRDDPAALRLRLHFFGTSNQSESTHCRVLEVASACGVADAVTEVPGRIDYLDALRVLSCASGILLLGTTERHYTASKLYPALLARRPILALVHEESSVVSILKAAGTEPTIRVVTYDRSPLAAATIDRAACHLRAFAAGIQYRADDVSLDRIDGWSAQSLARRLAAVFDGVAA